MYQETVQKMRKYSFKGGTCFFMGRKSKLTKEEKLQLCKDKLELRLSFKQLLKNEFKTN